MNIKEYKKAEYILEDYIEERWGWYRANESLQVDAKPYTYPSYVKNLHLSVYVGCIPCMDINIKMEELAYLERCYARNKLQNSPIIHYVNRSMNYRINPHKNPKLIAERKMRRKLRDKQIKLYHNIDTIALDF